MSGTSADGVDVAVVQVKYDPAGDLASRIHSIRAVLVIHHSEPYNAELRKEVFALRGGAPFTWPQLAGTGRRLTLAHASAVRTCLKIAKLFAADIDAVADHGQTFFHDPPNTVQWLDPALLAAETGSAVISDFRRADCAAGGQGAPLVPFADYILFRHPTRSRVLLNIGGIANLTFLPAGGSIHEVVAFDTGPGNCISDALVSKSSGASKGFDAGGALAATGQRITGLVDRLMRDPYYNKPPPKSTDRPAMIASFDAIAAEIAPNASLPSLLHGSCQLTATSIVHAMRTFLKGMPDELFISGGGVENATMMRMLSEQLKGIPIRRTDELGIASQAKEAMAFAIIGAATLWGIPANVPSATGARTPVILGSITPRPTP